MIEAEILHCPDSFDMGYDIQQYYALHQSLTLEDLARANSRHTLNGLMRVVSKVSVLSRDNLRVYTTAVFKE